MTKEDFEHNHIKGIAEEYVQETWGSFLDLCPVDLVLAGIGVAKIISKEKDERIVELETQIEKMKCCENCKYNSYWGNELHCNYGLKEVLQEDKLVECNKMDKWEIKENDR